MSEANSEERPPVLSGRPATEEETFWARKIWELEAEGPAVLAQSSQQLMSQAALLSGIYLATLGVFGVKELADPALRALSLLPYLAWLPSILFAYLAYRPHHTAVVSGDAAECRAQILAFSARKRRWARRAEVLLLLGLLLAVGWVAYYLILGPTPPSPTPTGG